MVWLCMLLWWRLHNQRDYFTVYYNTNYPSLLDLKVRAKKRIPKFAFDFLEGGCTDENSLNRNQNDLQKVVLQQDFIRPAVREPNLKSSLCGMKFDAPFGISPVGFQGIIWPRMSLILAKAAKDYNIPYICPTSATQTLEHIAQISEGQALFQLYVPTNPDIRDHLILRLKDASYRALIITVDIASQSYRPRESKNGLLPPRFKMRTVIDVMRCPKWSFNMLYHEGIPKFSNLLPYAMGENGFPKQSMAELRSSGLRGSTDFEDLKAIRDMWDGILIIKGVLSERDMQQCIALGIDGVIVSNHGARQLDNGQTSISVLPPLAEKYGDKIHINFDSGIQSGVNIASALASGANFAFAGRAFHYGVAALGVNGAGHTIEMFTKQLKQVLCQIGCDDVKNLPDYLIR